MSEDNKVKSVLKAMRIFEVLVNKGGTASLSCLSREVKMNISTVHRLLNTLLSRGYIEQNEEGLYKLGFKSYSLADKINDSFNLRNIVHPCLQEIVDICNETTNLVILEEKQVVYIDQVQSTNMVRMFAGVGSRGPAYCTGAGKVLLAYLPVSERETYLQETEFESFTDNTIVSPDKLRTELKKIKGQGYALDREEKEKGVRCAAAPVFGRTGKVIAAISVSGPGIRVTDSFLHKKVVPLVCEKAFEVSAYLQDGSPELNLR